VEKSVNVVLILKTGKWKLLRLYADYQTLTFGSEIDLQKLFYWLHETTKNLHIWTKVRGRRPLL